MLPRRGLCDRHSSAMQSAWSEISARGRTRRTVEAQAEPAEARDPNAPDALGRVPVKVRAERLARIVHAAGGPVTKTEAAEAIGLESIGGTLPRIIRTAANHGWVRVVYGGIVAGDVAPPSAS